MKNRLFFFITFLALFGTANADCTYDGTVYPEGTIIGPYVCSGGKWVR